MKPPHEKPSQGEEATGAGPSRMAEIRKVVEEYASELREIARKLRKQLN
jgi:hypothetical protein